MISETLCGVGVSLTFLTGVRILKIGRSLNSWVLSIAKFTYHAGHPLLDDNKRFELVTKAYRVVLTSFLVVLVKIAMLVLLVAAAIALFEFGTESNQTALSSLEFWADGAFPQYILRWPFIVGTLFPLALAPFFRGTKRDDEYSALDKFLHYFFLGNQGVVKFQWWLECALNRKSPNEPVSHVYVAGLARSGSTSLMQYLGQLPDFASLSYRNMPFLFMPRTGPRLLSRKDSNEQERSHKDGMKHSLETYEALEEPFWLHALGPEFVREESLTTHSIPSTVHAKYRKFRTLVAGEGTYLAKNNNHLLRARSLHQLDSESGLCTRTVIPFREPYAQAKSLLRQHSILSKLQKENEFALDYMDFLVHHEFGLHAKTFHLCERSVPSTRGDDLDSLEHWLGVWHSFYQDALSLFANEPDFCFFCYEDYTREPTRSLFTLCEFLDVSPELLSSINVKTWQNNHPKPADGHVRPDCKLLYEKMVQVAINHEV